MRETARESRLQPNLLNTTRARTYTGNRQSGRDEGFTLPCTSRPRSEMPVSPLCIDEQFNITMPLYPHIRINMQPLQKAIYILLLMHPEGILIKEIGNYETEFREIYCAVSGRMNRSVIERVTSKMMNPADNLIHKSLSMIKNAFLCRMPDCEARHYMPVTGRSVVHRIPIDRKIVYTKYRFGRQRK